MMSVHQMFSRKRNAILMILTLSAFGFLAAGYKPESDIQTRRASAYPGYIDPDSVNFSFVFVGCNRVGRSDLHSLHTDASTANLPELQRTFEEVSRLPIQPDMFFFLGDLVFGLEKSSQVLENELSAWVDKYEDTGFSSISSSGIEMIAVPGNHEMLYYDNESGGEVPWSGALPSWMSIMGSFMPNASLNRVTGSDSLNNLATFSFRHKNTHFIVMNTDTYNSNGWMGRIPVDWIIADIQSASQDKSVEHIFLLGHKPSYFQGQIASGEEGIDVSLTNKLWPVMENNQVEAMLSAHVHLYDRSQPNPQKSYQIIAGNGGSPYSDHPDIKHQFFGYTIIYIMKDGSVKLSSMGRTVPADDYLEILPKWVKTTPRDQIDITWGSTAPAW